MPKVISRVKPHREYDVAYSSWIESLPCLGCQATTGSIGHHWQKKGHGGKSTKTSDRRRVPLCHNCHSNELHQHGRETFMAKHDLTYDGIEWYIATLNNIYDNLHTEV